jgi:hypothetical protein
VSEKERKKKAERTRHGIRETTPVTETLDKQFAWPNQERYL